MMKELECCDGCKWYRPLWGCEKPCISMDMCLDKYRLSIRGRHYEESD